MIRMILGKKIQSLNYKFINYLREYCLSYCAEVARAAGAQQISGFEFKNATQKSARLGLIAIGLHLTKTHMCKLLAKS